MSKRVVTKQERIKKAEKRRKMLLTFYLCLLISIILVTIYLIIYIPMAANWLDPFLNPFNQFFYTDNDFLLFLRNLILTKVGIITLADVLTSFMLSLFFAFLLIGVANLMEYKREVAGILVMIILISATIPLTFIYAFAAGSGVIIAFTSLGCILTIAYIYAAQ